MKRNLNIELIRVIACCLVLIGHCCERYYVTNYFIGGLDNPDIEMWRAEAFWAGIICTVCRTSVPLFVMVSGFLLLPMKEGTTTLGF